VIWKLKKEAISEGRKWFTVQLITKRSRKTRIEESSGLIYTEFTGGLKMPEEEAPLEWVGREN
jgi:hypothetical protein